MNRVILGKEDVVRNWAIDRTFTPAIPASERDEMVRGWERAVQRSLQWATD